MNVGDRMTNVEKIYLLQENPPRPCCVNDYYYDLLEKNDGIKYNYSDYMTTAPINCDAELERVPTADFDLCGALLTMLLREDHFSGYGCFERRYNNGDVRKITKRMIEVLRADTPKMSEGK